MEEDCTVWDFGVQVNHNGILQSHRGDIQLDRTVRCDLYIVIHFFSGKN